MEAGVLPQRVGWKEVFRRRLFPRPAALPDPWWSDDWRRVKTSVLGASQAEHVLRYAF
jgi:hypothetical protein